MGLCITEFARGAPGACLMPPVCARPCRFELPDLKGRAAIFTVHSKGMNLERGVR